MKISDFVIGLGFDSREFDTGMKNAKSSLGGFKSDVLQLSAVLGSAFGFHEMTMGFSRQNNELRQMSDLLGITTDKLYGLQQATRAVGGEESEMSSLLTRLMDARAKFDTLGEIGIFKDLALVDVDIDKLNSAKDVYETVLVLADELSKLTKDQQRIALDRLGLSPQMFDLLKQGGNVVRQTTQQYEDIRPHTQEMAQASSELIKQWNVLQQLVGGRADVISKPLVEAIAMAVGETNKWIEANHKLIDSFTGGFFERLGENIKFLFSNEKKELWKQFWNFEVGDELPTVSIGKNVKPTTSKSQFTESEDAVKIDVKSFTKNTGYDASSNKPTEANVNQIPIVTTANINVVMNSETLGTAVATLINGELDSTKNDLILNEGM